MNFQIVEIKLDEGSIVRWNPEIDRERRGAIYDLIEENYFAPESGLRGPFNLYLVSQENRLVFEITSMDAPYGKETVVLSLMGFRRLIKDYFTVCESYYNAIKHSSLQQIEALDMGRRSLHNEGSELLLKRLSGKIGVDFNTARRLFTLICILQLRG